ncbi:14 kda phosphohistidine phosphatase-like [Plakobranchus ocellatus]|uniref:14 kDa phosphohistidine phosphatase-like n=1 Tax=Plakobranchus ocellatus TaxID=259542 RepID=A0AAV4DWA1_9GAST|nr:14 kda phosphohistidine phosphatase-like [Plakobranchus ocellatus]
MASRSSQTASATSYKNPKLRDIPEVEIDKHGKFKYILIKVHDPDVDREFKHIIRGTAKAAFHADLGTVYRSSPADVSVVPVWWEVN